MNLLKLYLQEELNLDKKKEGRLLKPIVQIGKNGLSEGTLIEIKKHLKKRKLIKIKCLKYYLDASEGTNKEKMKQTADTIASYCNAEIVSIVGFTIVLWQI